MKVIDVINIRKDYFLFKNPAEVLIKRFLKNKEINTFSALKGVSFWAKQGETVGIVGHNGSGKSTLLQVITGVLNPTSGSVVINGRVAALLELGSGFNPEFTGLENIYYNAAILGLKKEETDTRLETILKFADIGDFVHRPVKTYSSGMMLRLAFSVVINIDPDILIVDEALAVGDDAFQRKCFSRLKELKDRGTTILLVSHSASQIVDLCDRAILLDHGEILSEGDPKIIINNYHKLLFMEPDKKANFINYLKNNNILVNDDKEEEFSELSDAIIPESTVWYEQRGAKIYNTRIENSNGKKVNILKSKSRYNFCYDVVFEREHYNVGFSMMIKSTSGTELGGSTTHTTETELIEKCASGSVYKVKINFECNLRNGCYFINCGCLGIIDGVVEFLHRGVDVFAFNVIEQDSMSTGLVDFSPQYQIEK